MRTPKDLNREIERCQSQIAATYEDNCDIPLKERAIIREGFQIQLGRLMNQRALNTFVIGAMEVLPNGKETLFRARAKAACNFKIAEAPRIICS